MQAAKPSFRSRGTTASEELLMRLQRTVGNDAVSRLLTDSAGERSAVQSATNSVDGLPVVARSATPAMIEPQLKADDKATLDGLTTMTLIVLYIYDGDEPGSPDPFIVKQANASYGKQWIKENRDYIKREVIIPRLKKEHDRVLLYREMVQGKPGRGDLIAEMQGLLLHEHRQDPKRRLPLTQEQGMALASATQGEIMFSVAEYGQACQNQLADFRAEQAEEGEFLSLVLGIAFSFVPVIGGGIGKALGRAVEKGVTEETTRLLEKSVEKSLGKELFGKSVEAALEVGKHEIKGHPSHQSGAEQFIGRKAYDAALAAAKDLFRRVDKMPYAEMWSTLQHYGEMDKPYRAYFEAEISETLEKYKKSAGHVGETRAWEYGRYRATVGGKTQAAKINTGNGTRLALITYETNQFGVPANGQPVWLDWIPKEMEKLSADKTVEKYGAVKDLAAGEYKIPGEYQGRWFAGLAGS